jgi:nucleoside transporter
MNFLTRLQLSAMMFLNFFVWGIWFVTMNVYLKSIDATDVQVGLAYGTQALGAIIAPFVIGLIADRFFDAQKILGILHLAGAALMYYITTVDDFSSFYPILLVYMILFMPTLALVNAISFKQMSNPEKEFSYIRLWGTIGWIATGWVITMMGWERDQSLVNTFLTAAVVSLALGIYSFTLPKTPPPKAGQKVSVGEILGLGRIRIIKRQEFPYIFLYRHY